MSAAPATGPASMPPWHQDAAAWLCAAAATALWVLLAAPVPGYLDAGELVAGARELGVLHPPGHPAWLSLAGLQEALPIGSVAPRLAWLSAVAAGAALWLTLRLTRRLAHASGIDGRANDIAAWSAGATLLASGSVWMVATRVEVYTLAWAGHLGAIVAAVAAGDAALTAGRESAAAAPQAGGAWRGLAAWAVVLCCLGLLNHHYLTLWTLPAVAVAAWPAWRLLAAHRRAAWALLGCAALLGLGYLALPLRAASDVELRWADPSDGRGLWDHVRAAHFQRSVVEGPGAPWDGALMMLTGVVERMGVPLGALGLGGLVLLVRRPSRLAATAWGMLLAGLGGKALMAIDLRNVDDHGYALVAVSALAVGAGYGAGLVAQTLGRQLARLAWLAPALVASLALGQVAMLAVDPDTAPWRQRGADAVDDATRRQIGPGGLWLATYYGTAFQEQAFRLAEGRRPDIAAAHLSFRTGDTDGGRGFARFFSKRWPSWAAAARGARSMGKAPVGNLLAWGEQGLVSVEHDPDNRIPPAVLGQGVVAHRLLPDAERRLDYDLSMVRKAQADAWAALEAALPPRPQRDHALQAALLWQHALEAAHALRRGWREVARDALARGRAIAPHDRSLDALDARLRRLDDAWARADVKAYHALWQSWLGLDLDALLRPATLPLR